MSNGEWRLSYIGEALVVSSGLVFCADKKPKGLSFEDMMQLIKEHPRESYYVKKIKRRVTLGDALNNDKFWEMGKEIEMTSSIDLVRLEHDRIFKQTPKSGQQLLKNKYQGEPKRLAGKVKKGIREVKDE